MVAARSEQAGDERLVGWKAIAAHLGVSQRTAARWADAYALPVSRVPRGNRPLIFATIADLDAWWSSPNAREAQRGTGPGEPSESGTNEAGGEPHGGDDRGAKSEEDVSARHKEDEDEGAAENEARDQAAGGGKDRVPESEDHGGAVSGRNDALTATGHGDGAVDGADHVRLKSEHRIGPRHDGEREVEIGSAMLPGPAELTSTQSARGDAPGIAGTSSSAARSRVPSFLYAAGLCAIVAALSFIYWQPWKSGKPTRTLPWALVQGAHGEARSARDVELQVSLPGQPWSTVALKEGEMARLETAKVRVGFQPELKDGELFVLLYRLGPFGSGESAIYTDRRALTVGEVVRVSVGGQTVDLTWHGMDAAGGLAGVAREPCCIVCSGVTLCGATVSARCGSCEGKSKETGSQATGTSTPANTPIR